MNSTNENPTLHRWLVVEREYHVREREYVVEARNHDEADMMNLDELTPDKEFDLAYDYTESEVLMQLDDREA